MGDSFRLSRFEQLLTKGMNHENIKDDANEKRIGADAFADANRKGVVDAGAFSIGNRSNSKSR